jgi:hypothetical protein
MTRIVRTAYRYKRPPRKRKPVPLEVLAVIVKGKSSRRPADSQVAAEVISLVPPYTGQRSPPQQLTRHVTGP